MRHAPDDPREWLNRAISNLAIAQTVHEDVYYEDLCFNAQQAAEKALKSVLLHLNVRFPFVHDLSALLTLIEQSGHVVPPEVRECERLTQFAVAARYPGVGPAVTVDEYAFAVRTAERVVEWAEAQLND
jgi:HEPN domain-containing protein